MRGASFDMLTPGNPPRFGKNDRFPVSQAFRQACPVQPKTGGLPIQASAWSTKRRTATGT